MRPVPSAAIALAVSFEGFRSIRYVDVAGNPTTGYGHLLSGPDDPYWAAVLTKTDALVILGQDMASRAAQPLCNDLGNAVSWLSDNQYATLCDFVFNEGIGHWHASTLRTRVLGHLFEDVPNELGKWIYGAGRVLPDLVRRRAAEAALWNAA